LFQKKSLKLNNLMYSKGQFHQRFIRRFYKRRSQKCKTDGLTVLFALLGSLRLKALCKMLVKSTPTLGPPSQKIWKSSKFRQIDQTQWRWRCEKGETPISQMSRNKGVNCHSLSHTHTLTNSRWVNFINKFTSSFFIWICFTHLLCAYSFGLYFLSKENWHKSCP